jgi:hypothetical protein
MLGDTAEQELEHTGKQFREESCHHSCLHWFAWLQFGVFGTCLASLKSIILFLNGGNNLI